MTARLRYAFGLLLCLGCGSESSAPRRVAPPSSQTAVDGALSRLREHETALRRATEFESAVPSNRALGPNPYRLCPLPSGNAAGVLRGSSELALLDGGLRELARAAAPTAPSACAVTTKGDILVGGELAPELAVYRAHGGELTRTGSIALAPGSHPRALATRGQHVYVADALSGNVLDLRLSADGRRAVEQRAVPLCRGPFALEVAGDHLIAACLLDHAIVVRALGADGALGPETARVVHDGPFWGFDAAARDGALLIAAGGVEDHPLVREKGAFGYVDSFLYLYRVRGGGVERLQAINASELSALTPKALALELSANGGATLLAAGYGGDALVSLRFTSDLRSAPEIAARSFVPGSAALVKLGQGYAFANPLLDAWVSLDGASYELRRAASELPAPSVRLGEALFFTSLIAPWAASTGQKSRFTCETCHFEGGIDGRVHNSGRDGVRVTTRPLFGLLNNAPHFSRALDPDLTAVSHHEFRVAGLGNSYDPWFSVERRSSPWLSELGSDAARLEPEVLRRALLDFLAVFHHEPNPLAAGRARFSAEERSGAEVFRARCERCHSARLVSTDPLSAVDASRWEALVFRESGPIVWARGEHEKTGIVPYVHTRGTRVPSLRRLVRKWPYFTNGSARSLEEVLDRAAFKPGEFWHADAPSGALRLTDAERAPLLAFLRLL